MLPGQSRARLVEELTDAAMYFGDVLNIYGVTPQEFSRAYYDKMRRNLRRDYHAEHKERYGE
ncbi:MAG: nucleotide pyrophosphohydrolase, partial [Clostridia bacterium]|nr:nucleotide pyrophosphohydrolase [Clostridia bacterium]